MLVPLVTHQRRVSLLRRRWRSGSGRDDTFGSLKTDLVWNFVARLFPAQFLYQRFLHAPLMFGGKLLPG